MLSSNRERKKETAVYSVQLSHRKRENKNKEGRICVYWPRKLYKTVVLERHIEKSRKSVSSPGIEPRTEASEGEHSTPVTPPLPPKVDE